MESNPYAPPQVTDLSAPLSAAAEAEAIRKAHIKTEAGVKSVGTLYYLGAFLAGLAGIGSLVAALGSNGEKLWVPVVLIAIALLYGFLANGLRRLRSWARWPTVALSLIGLIGFPIGTLISIVILASVLGAKPNMVFSPAYQDIIAATPHVKHKNSVAALVILFILALILIGVIASVSMG